VNVEWQYIVVAVSVVWAVGLLARRVYRLFFEPAMGSCGSSSCHGCPSNETKSTSGLIQLQTPTLLSSTAESRRT
jgi:hypothetical protein